MKGKNRDKSTPDYQSWGILSSKGELTMVNAFLSYQIYTLPCKYFYFYPIKKKPNVV